LEYAKSFIGDTEENTQKYFVCFEVCSGLYFMQYKEKTKEAYIEKYIRALREI